MAVNVQQPDSSRLRVLLTGAEIHQMLGNALLRDGCVDQPALDKRRHWTSVVA